MALGRNGPARCAFGKISGGVCHRFHVQTAGPRGEL